VRQVVIGFSSLLKRLLVILAGLCFCLMAVHVTTDVLMKYIFGRPIVGTLETVTYYYMVAAVFLPLVAVEAERRQVAVELFTSFLPVRALAALDAVIKLVLMGYVGLMAWAGYVSALRQTRVLEVAQSVAFQIYIWPSRWFVVIGCGAMLVYLFLHFIEDLLHALTGRRISLSETAAEGAH
jgi:TRAP-type C4-dicarboxylate transport system permease small subunit